MKKCNGLWGHHFLTQSVDHFHRHTPIPIINDEPLIEFLDRFQLFGALAGRVPATVT